MKNKFKIQNSKLKSGRGYTLIEILVAVAIFSLVIAAPTGLFIASLRSQRRSLATREVIDSSSYALEYMGRALRMARKDDLDFGEGVKNCIPSGTNVNYEVTPDRKRINFRNYNDECQAFYLDGTLLKENKEGTILPLTSDDLEVNLVKFQLYGAGQGDDIQPRATILLVIRKTGQPETEIRVQTTISQRNLDVTY